MALIYDIDAEPTDFSEWDNVPSTTTALTNTGTNPITGSRSFRAAWKTSPNELASNNGTTSGADDSAGAIWRIGFRFRFDSVVFGTDASAAFFVPHTDATLGFYVSSVGGNPELLVAATNLATYQSGALSNDGSTAYTCEIRLVESSGPGNNDSEFTLYLNGSQVDNQTGLNDWNFASFTANTANFFILSLLTTGGSPSGAVVIDDIVFRDDDTEIFPSSSENSFRFLGMAADDTHLIVTGLKNGATLTAYRYDLATLTENGTATFGTATNAEIDAGTRWLAPVWSYGNTGKWFMYGRDGNNVQVQVNTTGGTGTWTDTGAGTATWATTKVAVALMPAVLDPDDLIVAFSDDDIYRSIDDGTTWVKQGDAGGTLNYARRHGIHDERLMLGGTATGTVLYSHNWGQSFDDRSGTVLDGVVQQIAVSYNLP